MTTTGFQFMSAWNNHTAYQSHTVETTHADLPRSPAPFQTPTQVLSCEIAMAFDMEIELLIQSYILLLRDYTPLHDYSVVTSNR